MLKLHLLPHPPVPGWALLANVVYYHPWCLAIEILLHVIPSSTLAPFPAVTLLKSGKVLPQTFFENVHLN